MLVTELCGRGWFLATGRFATFPTFKASLTTFGALECLVWQGSEIGVGNEAGESDGDGEVEVSGARVQENPGAGILMPAPG